MEERYNGYKNYETWLCMLWIDNKRSAYEFYREMARKLDGDKDAAIYELAQQIEKHILTWQPALVGLYADLMTSAIAKIDFYEIAKNIMEGLE